MRYMHRNEKALNQSMLMEKQKCSSTHNESTIEVILLCRV